MRYEISFRINSISCFDITVIQLTHYLFRCLLTSYLQRVSVVSLLESSLTRFWFLQGLQCL